MTAINCFVDVMLLPCLSRYKVKWSTVPSKCKINFIA